MRPRSGWSVCRSDPAVLDRRTCQKPPFCSRRRRHRSSKRCIIVPCLGVRVRLRRDFPDDPTMRISHEAIYQGLYIEGRGALSREYVACLRTGRALRVPRARTRRARRNQRGFITPEVTLDRRPAEVADRGVPGHWEGDRATRKSHVRVVTPIGGSI